MCPKFNTQSFFSVLCVRNVIYIQLSLLNVGKELPGFLLTFNGFAHETRDFVLLPAKEDVNI